MTRSYPYAIPVGWNDFWNCAAHLCWVDEPMPSDPNPFPHLFLFSGGVR